jgi:hypothetical protein
MKSLNSCRAFLLETPFEPMEDSETHEMVGKCILRMTLEYVVQMGSAAIVKAPRHTEQDSGYDRDREYMVALQKADLEYFVFANMAAHAKVEEDL